VAANAALSASFLVREVARSPLATLPPRADSSSSARLPASALAAEWSRSEAGRGDSSKTATVPAMEAIHQPASRSGIIEAVPADTAAST
jgi:hypothetical protein